MNEDCITYSRRKPTDRGHYWYRTEYGQDVVVSVHDFAGSDGLEAFITGEWLSVRRCKGQFAKAALPQPEPAKKTAKPR